MRAARRDELLSVRIPEKMKRALQEDSEEASDSMGYRVSLSQFVTKIIEDYLDAKPGVKHERKRIHVLRPKR